jgi:hypothetical protein
MRFLAAGSAFSLVVGMTLLLVGCDGEASREPTITQLRLLERPGDNQLSIRAEVGVSVDLANPGNLPLSFKWSTLRGRLLSATTNGPTNIYSAPGAPGLDTITVEVFGGKQQLTRSLQLRVIDPATGTPIPPPTGADAGTPASPPNGPGAGASAQSVLPLNVQLTNAAWQAFNGGMFEKAITAADRCLSEFRAAADEEQAELTRARAADPPTGPVTDAEKKAIDKRGLLNDVATCTWIKARSAENLTRKDDARAAYTATMTYTHARCWDPAGFYWSQAVDARRRLAALK